MSNYLGNSFNLMIMSMILLAALKCHIIMSVHCIGYFHVIYLFSFVIVCEPVDQGVGVQPRYFDDPYFLSHQQGKRKSPSLIISRILCFPTNILSKILLHTIPMSFVRY